LIDLKAVGEQQQLRSAAAQVESAQGKYQGAQAQLAYSEIRSPITGVVTDRPVNQGEMASTSSPLMTIMDVSSVIGKAHIPQADAALLKTGDKATLSPAEGVEVSGKVTVVSPALDPNSTTVEVWVEAPNPNNTLRPGSTVKVTFNAGSIPNAIAIPAAAILTAADGSNSVVVVAHDPKRGDVAHPRPVTVGIKSGDLVQITQGLNAGDEVVTVGAFGLEDNTRLAVAQPGSASPASAPAAEKE
jgi:RND family efflux transporter MFP subunit